MSEIPGETLVSDSTGSNAYLDQTYDSEDRVIVGKTNMDAAEALLYTHPEYDANVQKWEKYVDCYEANDIYRFIHKHGREADDFYKQRVKRGYYRNYVASVVDLFVAYLYHAPITRDVPATGAIAKFYRDCDRRSTSYEHFIKKAATLAQVVGHVGVFIDMPQTEKIFRNKKEEEEADHRPYLAIIKAQQITDWHLDQHGNFEWVKIQVDDPGVRSWTKEVDTDVKHFVIWTRDSWEKWEVEGIGNSASAKLVAEGDNPLGEVPLVIIRNCESLSHKWFGVSSVRDISDLNLAILNWSSLGDEEIFERCLNILAVEATEGQTIEWGHHNVLEYGDCTHPPQYLTPGTTPLELILKWIESAKDEIYRLAKLGGSTGLLGVREATSGIAYAYEFNETNQSLAQKAEYLEHGEREIHRLFYKWLSEEEEYDTITISYPREFGVEDFSMELAILMESRNNLTSKTAIREIEKSLTRKMFAKHPQELRNTIKQEIDKADARPVEPYTFENMPPVVFRQPFDPSLPINDPKNLPPVASPTTGNSVE